MSFAAETFSVVWFHIIVDFGEEAEETLEEAINFGDLYITYDFYRQLQEE